LQLQCNYEQGGELLWIDASFVILETPRRLLPAAEWAGLAADDR
jgi:hypothetical protein